MIEYFLAFILHVTILFDRNHDGLAEGVGPGVIVTADHGDQTLIGVTNQVSTVSFVVEPVYYTIYAEVPSNRLFFRWVCERFLQPTQPEETVTVRCQERFFLRLPFTSD